MDISIILIKIFSWLIFIFFILPTFLFLFYLITNELNKLYLLIVGNGNKWYQNFFIVPAGFYSYFNRRYLLKNFKQGEKTNHVAIVLANNYFPENILGFGLENAVSLVKYLKKKNKAYRVYNKITSPQLKKIINDKQVKSIFLFGHGERHGFKVGRNEVVYYCEFPNHPKKHLIAQFHCNHYSGKALSEYGSKPIYAFVTNKTQRHSDIKKQIRKIIKEDLLV
jgi:hypothetical protein